MSILKTLGGDRLGSGKKQKVPLHNYERSTHDLGYLWRSTMSSGTLVPFMVELAQPGDTYDIDLNIDVKTHPTVGPLFGSFKIQADIFEAPIRLYNALLHNNQLGIGLSISTVLLPQIKLSAEDTSNTKPDLNTSQINQSCLLAYLGIRGIGYVPTGGPIHRLFNCTPLLAYWEIYKNYYANKQEEIGVQIVAPPALITSVDSIVVNPGAIVIPADSSQGNVTFRTDSTLSIVYLSTPPIPSQIIFRLSDGRKVSGQDIVWGYTDTGTILASISGSKIGDVIIENWAYATEDEQITLETFQLSHIDDMRMKILGAGASQVLIDNTSDTPYLVLTDEITNLTSSQVGLGIKTYQSDIFNNWLKTEWIDDINTASAIDVSGTTITIDTIILARKVYDYLNRVAVSGGSYDDWLDATYATERITRCESPMYHGGLSKELIFAQIVSLANTQNQPLGTLGGRGTPSGKHKGGHAVIKVQEPAYIMGIISLTPRIDYSQGNRWDVHLQTLDDLHKPELDQIGFQELITEQMAWWDTHWSGTDWTQHTAGKQPAWINYMTNFNRTFGNFASVNNEMFMTLNRRYQPDDSAQIKDLTTYIDPSKYNYIFAETNLDAQNFWVQIAVDIKARRLMSAKIMPNL